MDHVTGVACMIVVVIVFRKDDSSGSCDRCDLHDSCDDSFRKDDSSGSRDRCDLHNSCDDSFRKDDSSGSCDRCDSSISLSNIGKATNC